MSSSLWCPRSRVPRLFAMKFSIEKLDYSTQCVSRIAVASSWTPTLIYPWNPDYCVRQVGCRMKEMEAPRQAFEGLEGSCLGTLVTNQYATAGTLINNTHSWMELSTPWRFLLARVRGVEFRISWEQMSVRGEPTFSSVKGKLWYEREKESQRERSDLERKDYGIQSHRRTLCIG